MMPTPFESSSLEGSCRTLECLASDNVDWKGSRRTGGDYGCGRGVLRRRQRAGWHCACPGCWRRGGCPRRTSRQR